MKEWKSHIQLEVQSNIYNTVIFLQATHKIRPIVLVDRAMYGVRFVIP